MGDTIVHRDRLLLHLSRMPKHLKGVKYQMELISHPNQRIHCSQLRYLDTKQGNGTQEFDIEMNFKEEDGFTLGCGWYEHPIEMTDKRALDDCYKRMKQLDREEESIKDWNDFGHLQDIRDERQWILQFIKECTTPITKKIKVIKSKQQDDYRAVLKAINRSKNLIGMEAPDLIPYIDEHLVIGIYCVWKEAV